MCSKSTPSMKKIPSLNKSKVCKRFGPVVAVSFFALSASVPVHAQSIWAGSGTNWSSNGNPGWNGTGVPDAVGASANFGTNGNSGYTVVLDAETRTVGSLGYSGSGNGSLSLTLTNALEFDVVSGAATLSNTSTGTGSRIVIGSGSIVLKDDLRISNTNTNFSADVNAITTGGSTVFSGAGNLTFSNANNNYKPGASGTGMIFLQGTSSFEGNVVIEKGAVGFSSQGSGGNGGLGKTTNSVTLGSAGQGAASLLSTANGSSATIGYNITVASGAGGTLLLGSSGTGAVNSVFTGALILNGDVSLASHRPNGNDTKYTGVISGIGAVTSVGTGETQFGDGSANITNTYKGNTTLTETSSLVLSNNAKLTFYIEGSGVNNKITGANNNVLTLEGDFVFDLSAASTVAGASWSIVDVGLLNETFGATFTVVDFLADGGGVLWTKDIDGTSFYQFSEATGVLSVVPEPGACALATLGLTMLLFRRRRP